MLKIAIAAGGTGGHLYPALATWEELKSLRPATKVLWFCSRRRVDKNILEGKGLTKVVPLPTKPFPFRPSLGLAVALLALLLSTLKALLHLLAFRPRVVLAFGSHAGAPAGVAASLLGIPLIVHEQNVIPGRAVRLLARWAKLVAVSHPATVNFLKGARRAEVVGTPIRSEFGKIPREEARRKWGVPNGAVCLLTFGGSLGSRRINEALLSAWPLLEREEKLFVIQVAGSRDHPWVKLRAPRHPRYRLLRYADDMPSLLACADIVLCRAGASTLAEISACGLPSILVPYPFAAEGHQRVNARLFHRAGAAEVVEEESLTEGALAEKILQLVKNEEKRRKMGHAVKRLASPGAARRMAQILLEWAER